MKRPRLASVRVLKNLRLRLVFVDGSAADVDFSPLLEESPGLAPLADPAAFRAAQIIEGEGWAVVWPALDIQIGADTLWLDALAQNATDENTRTFARWRARHGLSLAAAGQALGLAPRTISRYGRGVPVPRHVALACKGWEAEAAAAAKPARRR